MIMRMAEVYLIAAEASVRLNKGMLQDISMYSVRVPVPVL